MGTCQGIAEKIAEKLGVEAINVGDLTADVLNENENLLLGTSTWGSGEMQDDWYEGVKLLDEVGLKGKTVAIFGCGDSNSNADTFCGGMAELCEAATNAGANVLEGVPTEGYTFEDSPAVKDGKFVGLATMRTRPTRPTNASMLGWHRLSPRCNVGKPTWREP